MRNIARFLTSNWGFLLILALAFSIRVYGINWDQNQHLHPDERFLTMVTQAISFPSNPLDYFNTTSSPLNPHNVNFSFYVYGTFPLFLVKLLTTLTGFTDYDQVTLLGRFISTLFDLGTITLIYLIGLRFSKGVGLLSSFFYSISVLAIQLSHFYAVDTFLNFFITLMVYLLIKFISHPQSKLAFLIGLVWGLALACKINAVLLSVPLGLTLLGILLKDRKQFRSLLINIFLMLLVAGLTFRVFQPYAFGALTPWDLTPNPKFINNIEELQRLSKASIFFPPSVQWVNTAPILYPLRDLIIWGAGAPLGVIYLSGFFYVLFQLIKHLKKLADQFPIIILLATSSIFFFYQGLQDAKPIRYFLFAYPSLAIFASLFLFYFKHFKKLIILVLILVIIWPLAFLSIYTRPHSRVTASRWIYQNIPTGTSLAHEHWDDGLPLSLEAGFYSQNYGYVEFPLYAPDNPEKWNEMSAKLSSVDYIILSSNRLYAATTRLPDKYPITTKYYQALFDGRLGFDLASQFSSRPNLPLPFLKLCLTPPLINFGSIAKPYLACELDGVSIVDDFADETFTVYDHPKVLIFKKAREVDYASLFSSQN